MSVPIIPLIDDDTANSNPVSGEKYTLSFELNTLNLVLIGSLNLKPLIPPPKPKSDFTIFP